MDMSTWIANNIVGIFGGAIIPTAVLLARYFKETPTDKRESMELLLDKYENWARIQEEKNKILEDRNRLLEENYDALKQEYKKNKEKINEIELKMSEMSAKIKNSDNYKKKYYSSLNWIEDVIDICKKENVIDKVPLLPTKVKNDIKKR